MSVIDTLVTDRWPGGYYGVDDLNRVGEALRYISDRLRECGLSVPVSPKTDWQINEFISATVAKDLLDDLSTIRNALKMPPDVPAVPDGVRPFNTQEANDIERILAAVEETIQRVQSTIDLGWALGIAHVGLYAGTDTGERYIMLENGNMLANDMDELQDIAALETAPSFDNVYAIIECDGENYRFGT